MPNRIIREGIIDSQRMERLVRDAGWAGEVFYRRLQQVVDDFGRFDGRLAMLKARCYPTVLDLVRDSDIERWIAACVKSGLVRVYEVKGQAFVQLLDFRQQVRATASKWPEPPPCEASATHPPSTGNAGALVVGDGIRITESKTKKSAARFEPPTIDDVRAYCKERKSSVDPETFIDFYASKGWKIGKETMKDWRASVRTWEKREGTINSRNGSCRAIGKTPTEPDEVDAILAELHAEDSKRVAADAATGVPDT